MGRPEARVLLRTLPGVALNQHGMIEEINAAAIASKRITTRAEIYDKYEITRKISDLYKLKYGITIWATVQAAVMSHAKHVVIDTGLRIGAVADRLGYANIYTFSESYKNYFGESPMKSRKRHLLVDKKKPR